MRVYIAGPMRGISLYNFPAFVDAADAWRRAGYEVINPAEEDMLGGFDPTTEVDPGQLQDFMRRDFAQLVTCDAIALLPGWRDSFGAMLEYRVALACGLRALDAETFNPIQPESVCGEADRIVGGARQSTYGHPKHDFARTARIWSGVLMDKLKGGVTVSSSDVALCMVGVKMSREVNSPKRDNRVDGCGYFKTLDMLYE